MSEPGVYVQDPPSEPPAITGAPTSVTAFIGRTRSGAAGSVTAISDLGDYVSQLGPVSANLPLSLAVRDYFGNGGIAAVVFSIGAPGKPLTEVEWLAAVNALDDDTPFNILALTPDVPGEDIPAAVIEAAAARCAAIGAMAILGPPAAWQAAFEAKTLASLSVEDLGPLPLSSRQCAAVYFPNLIVPDPDTAAPITASPVGAVAGAWAAAELAGGVWVAPAGVRTGLIGVLDLAAPLTDSDSQVVADAGINPLRSFANYGLVVWGAHTLTGVAGSGDPFRYIQVRRTVTYIEQSVTDALAWVEFQPGDPPLWASITQEVTAFLHTMWAAGAFPGATAGAAFDVICDASNNTPQDLAAGIVNVEILVALLEPAEFQVINLQFVTASAS